MNIGTETKNFHIWLKEKFRWVDPQVKKYMFKAWCGRAKEENSGGKKKRQKKETKKSKQD